MSDNLFYVAGRFSKRTDFKAREGPGRIDGAFECLIFPESVKGGDPSYDFESLDFQANDRKLSGYIAFFREVDRLNAKPHTHPGVELVYVVRGRLAIRILDEDRLLDAGDSIYLDSTAPHSYRRVGRAPCEAVVVTTG